MPRARMIKPDFWDDEKLSTISRDARLFYIGMWNFSDDYGVIKGNISWLKNKIFPYNNTKDEYIKKWLMELRDLKRILFFKHLDESFYFMPFFIKHQTISHPSSTRNPEPPDTFPEDSGDNLEDSENPPSEYKISEVDISKDKLRPFRRTLEDYLNDVINNQNDLFFLKPHLEKIKEFFAYRMQLPKKSQYKTQKGIDGLMRDLVGCYDAGYDICDCLDITMEKEWLTPSPSYFENIKLQKKLPSSQSAKLPEIVLLKMGVDVLRKFPKSFDKWCIKNKMTDKNIKEIRDVCDEN